MNYKTFEYLPGRVINHRQASLTDKIVIEEIFNRQVYNLLHFKQSKPLFSYYDIKIKDGLIPIIVDAGANIGAATHWFLMMYPTSKILAIEPEKNNVDILKQNVRRMNVSVFEGALGSLDGQMILVNPGKGDWAFQVKESGEGYPVRVFTGDIIMGSIDMQSHFAFICKIDIEGGEDNLFKINTEWLKLFPVIIIEIHDWMIPGIANSKSFFKFIAENNYDIVYRGELIFAFNNDLLQS